MANPFESFWVFVYLVGTHTVTLLAGCVVTVMLGIIEKYILKRSISIKWEIVILVAFIFFACFQTWRDEHHSLASLQDKLKNPTFNGRISGIFAGFSEVAKKKVGMIYLTADISNPHGPASGLMNWKMGIRNPKVGTSWGGFLPLFAKGQMGILGHGMPSFTFPNNKYLPAEAFEPIPAGAWITGWYGSTFTEDQIDEAYREHYFLVLQFEDVASGVKHTIERQLPERGTHPIIGAAAPSD
jgi:hypothetical protein